MRRQDTTQITSSMRSCAAFQFWGVLDSALNNVQGYDGWVYVPVAKSPIQNWSPTKAMSKTPKSMKSAIIRPLFQAYVVPPHL